MAAGLELLITKFRNTTRYATFSGAVSIEIERKIPSSSAKASSSVSLSHSNDKIARCSMLVCAALIEAGEALGW